MTDKDTVAATREVNHDTSDTASPYDARLGKPRKSLVAWLRERVLYIGGVVGAVTALVTLPGLVLSTWNGSLRVIDSWSQPDIVVAVGQLKLRCLIVRPPNDSKQITLEDNCDPGNVAVSGRFALSNHDRIARNVTNLRAQVQFLDGPTMQVALDRPLSVRHEVVNGTDTAKWFDWKPVNLDPQSTHVEEIAFDQHGATPTQWEAVREALFHDVNKPAWSGVAFVVWATVFGETDELEVLRCSARFRKKHFESRHQNLNMQNRMPFNCIAGGWSGLVGH